MTISKRRFVQCAVVGALGVMPDLLTSTMAREGSLMALDELVDVLKRLDRPAANKAAARLALLTDSDRSYDLHLRDALLTAHDADLIAAALQAVKRNGGPALRSFSMSYNAELGDEGVLSVCKNLPDSVTEIGLVGCGVGDKGAAALIEWALPVVALRWLCVEDNDFSDEAKDRLLQLTQNNRHLLVIV